MTEQQVVQQVEEPEVVVDNAKLTAPPKDFSKLCTCMHTCTWMYRYVYTFTHLMKTVELKYVFF